MYACKTERGGGGGEKGVSERRRGRDAGSEGTEKKGGRVRGWEREGERP